MSNENKMPITDRKFWMNWPWSPDSTASVATPKALRMPLHNAGNATRLMAPTASDGTNNTTDVFISRSRASLSASLGGVMAVAWRRSSAGGCSLRRVGGGLKAAAACSSSASASASARHIFACSAAASELGTVTEQLNNLITNAN